MAEYELSFELYLYSLCLYSKKEHINFKKNTLTDLKNALKIFFFFSLL